MIEQGIQYICDTAKTPAQIVNSCFGFVHDTVSELENSDSDISDNADVIAIRPPRS